MIPAWLSILDAILAALLVGIGVIGAHMGMITPMSGFLMFLLSFAIAILALLFGLLGLARTSVPERRVEFDKMDVKRHSAHTERLQLNHEVEVGRRECVVRRKPRRLGLVREYP